MTQRELALRKANEVRQAVAELKREVKGLPRKEAFLRAAEIVEENDAPGVMRVEALVSSVRYVSLVRARKLFPFADRRVRELTVFERLELAAALRYAARVADHHAVEWAGRSK